VKSWAFQPQVVDGVPAQVKTNITIPFSAHLEGEAANLPEVRPLFDKLRLAGGLRLEGSPAFHMKASFHSNDGASQGAYEETWVSPTKWRREVKLNDTSLLEVMNDEDFYRVFPGKYAPRMADDVMDYLGFRLPGDNGGSFHDQDWKLVET